MENEEKINGPKDNLIDYDYEEMALETIRKDYPDASHSCFSGRYITGYNHLNEHVFMDRAGVWAKGWVPIILDMNEDEFVELLVKEGTDHLKNNSFVHFSNYDKGFMG
ncbi:MAG: hypothetical protein Q4D13_08355 [Erysipelotrichaceae bacterium]|nr:hypothetical protein [Erysipelotrichaceae bacterium]